MRIRPNPSSFPSGYCRVTSGTTCIQGDFNYDVTVNRRDDLLLDTTCAKQSGPLSPHFLSRRESQFGPAYVSDLLTTLPELCSLCTTLLLLLPRRRRFSR